MCFEDEDEQYAEKLLDYFVDATAIVPEIWPLEVVNALLTATRRDRLLKAEANHFFHLLSSLPVDVIVGSSALERYLSVLELACEYGLSSYDATYLALAMERAVPLATLDQKLMNAASGAGVALF